MKKKATFFIFPILFLAGLSLLLYPLVANQWNNYRQSRLISSYDESVARQESEGTLDYSQEWTKALTYNAYWFFGFVFTIQYKKCADSDGTRQRNCRQSVFFSVFYEFFFACIFVGLLCSGF